MAEPGIDDDINEFRELLAACDDEFGRACRFGDIARVREMLRIHGWKDRTAGDQPGEFRKYPLIEQTYFDMIVDGQVSVADSARVGIALQQMSLGFVYELLSTKLTKYDRKQLTYAKSYATNRMIAFRAQVNSLG